MKDKRKCYWCGERATKPDYREIDEVVSKIISCNECFNLSTNYLIKKYDTKRVL